MLLWLLPIAALFTAVLSGVFGMAGGMLLMGAYTVALPVATAMVLHGATQLVANGSRALLLRRHVYWLGLVLYASGAVSAFALLSRVHYVPSPLVVFAGLGAAPFVSLVLPARWFDFERPAAAVLCGAAVVAVQLLAGAAGPLLDIAFVRTQLTRNQVVATKAVTQVLSHALKIAYFAPLMHAGSVSPQLGLSLLVATLLGTRIGTELLQRLSDERFRRYSRAIILVTGSVYLTKAAWLCFL
ncbi:MAG TPA: sulfite exporter TauE/SafE family protein [Polyangiales bacterium]|jgi:uncharacterized membrane protein YfcA|nr:sulfite exporter TauE/SafE family protein [Polyangiales bacterium]